MLSDREHEALVAAVHEHPLEHLVEIERLAGNVLEVPVEFTGIDIDRDGRVRVEPLVEDRHMAARGHPGFGLCRAPVGAVELRIVAPRDPGVAALAEDVVQVGPGIAAGLARVGDRVEPPDQLSGGRVVRADEAAGLAVPGASAQSVQDLPVRDDRAARVRVPLLDHRLPDLFSRPRIEGHDARVRRGLDDVRPVDRDVAHVLAVVRSGRRLPDQVAGPRVQGLHDVARVDQVDHAVIDDGGGFGGPVVHLPDPFEAKPADVLPGDLAEGAVAVRVVVAPDHQPVGGIGVFEHLVGDGHEVSQEIRGRQRRRPCVGRLRTDRLQVVDPSAKLALGVFLGIDLHVEGMAEEESDLRLREGGRARHGARPGRRGLERGDDRPAEPGRCVPELGPGGGRAQAPEIALEGELAPGERRADAADAGDGRDGDPVDRKRGEAGPEGLLRGRPAIPGLGGETRQAIPRWSRGRGPNRDRSGGSWDLFRALLGRMRAGAERTIEAPSFPAQRDPRASLRPPAAPVIRGTQSGAGLVRNAPSRRVQRPGCHPLPPFLRALLELPRGARPPGGAGRGPGSVRCRAAGAGSRRDRG